MQILPIHHLMHVLSWLEGTWLTDGPGNVTFPTMEPIMYYDQINITSIGQPMFNYIAQSWHQTTGTPMHRETGFLQILPNTTTVVLSLINNIGLFTVEKGNLSDDNKSFDIESTDILATVASVKPVSSMTQTRRVYKLDDDRLELTFYMATERTPELTEHLHVRYKKV